MSHRVIKIPADMTLPIASHNIPDLELATLRELLGDVNMYLENCRPKGFANLLAGVLPCTLVVDEDGHSKELDFNLRASYLYGMHVHGRPILGDVLVVGEDRGPEGLEWTGLAPSITPYEVLNAVLISAMTPSTFED